MKKLLAAWLVLCAAVLGAQQFPPAGATGAFSGHSGSDPLGVAGLSVGLVHYYGFNGATKSFGTTPEFFGYDSVGGWHTRPDTAVTNGSATPIKGDWVAFGGAGNGALFYKTTETRLWTSFTVAAWIYVPVGTFSQFNGDIVWTQCNTIDNPNCVSPMRDWRFQTTGSGFAWGGEVNDTAGNFTGLAGNALTQNAWNRIVMTYDETTRTISHYQAGALVAGSPSSALPQPLRQTATRLVICRGSADYAWRVDEVAIWNRVLTTTQITADYNAGAGRFY